MKESKMRTINSILSEMEDDVRKNIEENMDLCLKAICCEGINWKEFLVYERSIEAMEGILKGGATEYIMAIADHLQSETTGIETVKISIIKGHVKDKSFRPIRQYFNTLIAVITIPKKEWELLKNK